jgi:TatD DNase family protein
MFIDTHAHLDFKDFDADRPEVIASAVTAGVEKIVNVGADMAGSRASVKLATAYESIFATVGIHPHDAQEATEDNINELERLVRHGKVVAIGEIGLDYFKSKTSPTLQKEAFVRQLDLAKDHNLPVIIHTRDAEKDVMDILRHYQGLQGVIHFFSGSPEFALHVIEFGLHVSFTGVITFKPRASDAGSGAKYDYLREQIINSIPLDRMMIETDCPFAAPEPYRGWRNEPAFVVEIAKKIAQYRGVPLKEIEAATTATAERFFKI